MDVNVTRINGVGIYVVVVLVIIRTWKIKHHHISIDIKFVFECE
jgi:hypothetical protein